MNISLRWLEEFLRRPLDPNEVAERLAMLGAPVDAVESVNPGLDDIVIGLVEEVRPFLDSVKTSIDEIVREVYGG